MPIALSIGIPYETFMHLVPNQLRAYYKAYKLKQKMRDKEAWMWWGNYGISALIFAIDHCLYKNPKSKYTENPLLQETDSRSKELSEEEKQRQVDLFFAREKVRRINWKRKHSKDDSVS